MEIAILALGSIDWRSAQSSHTQIAVADCRAGEAGGQAVTATKGERIDISTGEIREGNPSAAEVGAAQIASGHIGILNGRLREVAGAQHRTCQSDPGKV